MVAFAAALSSGDAGPGPAKPAPPPGSSPSHGAAAPGAAWIALAPGAQRATVDDGSVRLSLLRFDLERFDAEVVVAARERPPHARVWLPGPSHTAAEVLAGGAGGAGAVVAAVNGGFFDENGRSLGLRVTRGDVAVGQRGHVDWGVFYVAAGRAHIVHSRDFALRDGIDAAIQVGPRILIDGVVPKLKPQLARRTGIALDRDGKSVTLVISDRPIEAGSLGSRLAALGFQAALLLDGGPSTQLAAALGGERVDIPGGYPVPDLLAIVRRRSGK